MATVQLCVTTYNQYTALLFGLSSLIKLRIKGM
jgi:hypothetical protein